MAEGGACGWGRWEASPVRAAGARSRAGRWPAAVLGEVAGDGGWRRRSWGLCGVGGEEMVFFLIEEMGCFIF
jgi:hypothetical protein